MFVLSLFAESAYQKKTYQIYGKYYTLFKDGYSHDLTMSDDMELSVDPEGMTAIAAMSAIDWFPVNRLNQYIEQMESELKQAESLMTAEERKKKESMDRRKTSLGYYEGLIYNELMKYGKGEFEKTDDYKRRWKEKGNSKFISACNYYFPNATFDVVPLKYDADEELYDFQIKYKLSYADKTFTHDIMAAIPIEIEVARSLSQSKPSLSIIDCIWGVLNNKIAPQSCKIIINGKLYDVTTSATDLILKGEEIVPDIDELKSSSYNYSAQLRQRVENKMQLIGEIEQYNIKKEEDDTPVKSTIFSSPYYKKLPEYKKQEIIAFFNTTYFTYENDISVIEEYYHNRIHTSDSINSNNLLPTIKQYLKSNDKIKFAEAFFEESPDSMSVIRQEWLEYQCDYVYSDFYNFVVDYCDRKLNSAKRDCREIAWNKYSQYYNNMDEFNLDFNKGNYALKEREILCKRLAKNVEKIKELLNKDVENPVDKIPIAGLFTSETKKVSGMDLQGAFGNDNEYIKRIAKLYKELSVYSVCQEKAADIILLESDKAQKEYVKHGYKFASKAEFITAYFDPEYKKILKSRK